MRFGHTNQTTIANIICANPYLHIRAHYGTTARTYPAKTHHPTHYGYAQSKSIPFYTTKLVFGTRFLLFKLVVDNGLRPVPNFYSLLKMGGY
jgi:hypothetical protein